MFKIIRIGILIFILLAVIMSNYRSKVDSVSWKYTLWVNVYPINGDGSSASQAYIQSLTTETFLPVENFMRRSVDQYASVSNASIQIRLQPSLQQRPPFPPKEGSMLNVMWWSLQFRWWAFRHSEIKGPGPQVRLFVQYFDPKTARVHHSTALQKGLIGQVNAFAGQEMSEQNNVVIAHELLHTLGASDKYDLATDQPLFPDGFAEPELMPTFPQKRAEIMGGRIPLTPQEAMIPPSLKQVIMGQKTAEEIQLLHVNIKEEK